MTDPLGTQRSYNYGTSQGKLAVTAASLPSGSGGSDAASRVQDANGFVTQETDFLGVSTMYTWDINRRLPLATTQAAGRLEAQTTSTQWHPSFRLPVLVSEAGRSTAYTYDGLGNKLTESITDTATNQTRAWAWTYNAQGLASSQTAPNGGVSQYGYDAQGKLTRVTNPQGHVTQLAYDAAGRLAQQTAPNGLLTNFTYDARGRLLTQVRGGEASSYSYTPSGQLASATLPSGYSVSYRYDAAQRLTGALDNRGNSVQYTLDAMGNRVREEVKDANGNIALATTRVINSLNRIAAIQGATGQTTVLAFDANAEATSATDPLNQTTRQTLDALRRPVATTLADNTAASQAWNALNQLTQTTDPKGIATRYQRNAFGEVMAETSPDIGSLSYQRNAAGQVIGQTDAKGNTRQITRDALGRPTEIRHSANHITRYIWDQGQVGYLSKIDDNSGSTTYERDPLGRITGKSQTVNDNPNSPSSFTTRYSYQGGELAGISYPSGLKVIYRRNASGQISGIETQEPYSNPKRPSLLTPFISNLSYTALGQPKAWSWSNGDAANRAFDADGRMASNEFASYHFDAASRITGITQNLWASRPVTSGVGTGTVTLTELYQTPLSWSASYDSRNRLTGFNRAGAETRYSYDANSNRLTAIDKTTSDTDLDGLFDADDFSQTSSQALNIEGSSNKLLGFSQTHSKTKGGKTLASTSSNVSYSLDANGNLTHDGLRSFDYDEANRLAKVKLLKDGEEASINYLHNGLGQRVFKGEPQAESYQPNEAELGQDFISWLKKNFQWLFAQAQANSSLGSAYVYGDEQLPEWAVLGDYDNGSATGKGRTEYIWLPTEAGDTIPVGMYRNGKFFAIHTDHLGTPRLITNEQNQPVWQWPYSAFGNNQPTGVLKATANPKAAMTNQPVLLRATNPGTEFDLRFPGQIADSEAGQFYNYFRTYDPKTGRYLQFDPIGLHGGLNRINYADQNALSRIDPRGLTAITFDPIKGTLTVDPETKGRSPYSMQASSGRPGCECSSSAKDAGPIPSGNYTMHTSQLTNPGLLGDLVQKHAR
ncbi:hypothetical protein LP417_11255 [Polaromonas sp. P1-6]|nr:hypothetical protein LP417_11255 [Polaromonas sp. P1-6]